VTDEKPVRVKGMRILLAPASEQTNDPHWETIMDIDAEGTVKLCDDEGLEDVVSAQVWADEYEGDRILDVQMPDDAPTPDAPPAAPEPAVMEAPSEAAPPEPREVPCPRCGKMRFVDHSCPYCGQGRIDGKGSEPEEPEPSHAEKALDELRDLVGRGRNLDKTIDALLAERSTIRGQFVDFLDKLFKKPGSQEQPTQKPGAEPAPAPEPEPAPDAPPASPPTLGEELENEKSDAAFKEAARLEQNVPLAQVRGITKAQAKNMAAAGLTSLGQFQDAFTESSKAHPWWAAVAYITTPEKAASVEDAVEKHWDKFYKKFHRD